MEKQAQSPEKENKKHDIKEVSAGAESEKSSGYEGEGVEDDDCYVDDGDGDYSKEVESQGAPQAPFLLDSLDRVDS